MTNRKEGDLIATIEVIEGKRESVENGKTWLRHKTSSEAGQIDLYLIKGASVSEIATRISCRERRVRDHFNHLQHGPSTMKPHRLVLKDTGHIWSFDLEALKQIAERSDDI
ncbi:MAG: hypothetical protein R3F53_15105 [Gammaproteobacteria bacterium]